MKLLHFLGSSILLMLVLTGCGVRTGPAPAKLPSSGSITFFRNLTIPTARLMLRPDPLVKQSMPQFTPPREKITVYLPVYPASVPVLPDDNIADAGTPMNGDLVDGTLYLESKDTPAQIEAWYAQQLGKLGYTTGSPGQSFNGKFISDFYEFTPGESSASRPEVPDISLGFLMDKLGDQTMFKLKVSYIVIPPRPKDSYLPNDIVKVVMTNGSVTRIVTDGTWIANVVHQINSLEVSTPGVGGGLTAVDGAVTKIQAAFYAQGGRMTGVTFSLLSRTITVGNSGVTLNSAPAPSLMSTIESVFSGKRPLPIIRHTRS